MKTVPTIPSRLAKLGPVAALAMMAAGHASAQDAVTVYGLLDVGAYSKQLSGEKRLETLSSGLMSSSRWGVRGTEDLGGGLKARFDMSSYIRLDTGESGRNAADTFWARYSWVGLESNQLGLFRLGRMSTPNFIQTIRFNAYGDSGFGAAMAHIYVGSAVQPMMTSHGTSDSMWANAGAYNTPGGLGGFEGALMYATSEGTTAGKRFGASGSYLSDSLSVSISVESMEDMGLNFSKPPASVLITDERSVQFAVAYDFKVIKLFGQYQQAKLENATVDIKLDTAVISASVPLGAGKVLLSAGHTTKEQTAVADVKRDTYTVGYDYNLSKRTDLYAVVLSDKVSNLDRGTGYSLGIRHTF